MPCFMNSGLDITTSGEKKYHPTNTGPNVRAWSSSISHKSRPLLSVSSVALPWKKLVRLGPGIRACGADFQVGGCLVPRRLSENVRAKEGRSCFQDGGKSNGGPICNF